MQTSELFVTANGFQAAGVGGGGGLPSDRSMHNSSSGDFEVALDPASSMIFSSDTQKNKDLKKMLDSNKDNLKLLAMKRIIAMVARGKDCSDLFADVVKNVVSKDAEVKKLVYVYLTRYAEEQQDLALLSISTFQRSLRDSNQLIRACALRVLSSIRIPVIGPILMLAIRDGAMDLSPYVRKTVAHAIPKLYSLEPDEKDLLIEVINRLLQDKSTLVAGSAVHAFEEVCPDRFDLIHKHFRKLCGLLMDVEEWGQVTILNMLTRYARTQFLNPKANNIEFPSKSAPSVMKHHSSPTVHPARRESESEEEEVLETESESDEEKEADEDEHSSLDVNSINVLRSDYQLLLRSCRLLLLSRNAAVVMAVSQLFYHCAPRENMSSVARALIRILHSSKEVQHVVLTNIATVSLQMPGLFDSHLRSFFVFNSDTTLVKKLKLDILTNLVTESTSPTILREFQAYVNSPDPEFVIATIQCIGRCASAVPQIAETCLTGLLRLMSRKNESMVAESVVVMRKLLQIQTSDHKDLIVHIAQMLDEITIPSARASILWLLGEYGHRVPKTAPDVLRKMAKTFSAEAVSVKLQILNLAAKLCILNPRQTQLLAQYVFTLAKYDMNYDIRDRSRVFRALIFPASKPQSDGSTSYLARNVKKILLATKPAPVLHAKSSDRPEFQLGSMSHTLGRRISGYKELPDWPLVPPDPMTRQVEIVIDDSQKKQQSSPNGAASWKSSNEGSQYSVSEATSTNSESDEEGEDDEGLDRKSNSGDEEEEMKEEDNAADVKTSDQEGVEGHSLATESSSSTDFEDEVVAVTPSKNKVATLSSQRHKMNISLSSLETEESEEEEEQKKKPPVRKASAANNLTPTKDVPKPPSVDLLLLDFDAVSEGLQLSSKFGVLAPTPISAAAVTGNSASANSVTINRLPQGETIVQLTIPAYEVAPKWFPVTPAYSEPLKVDARFMRTVSVFGPAQVNIELRLTNTSCSKETVHCIRADLDPNVSTASSKKAHVTECFQEVACLDCENEQNVFIGVDFCDSMQSLHLTLRYKLQTLTCEPDETGSKASQSRINQDGDVEVIIKPTVGELFQPITMTELAFVAKQGTLRGMHEMSRPLTNLPEAMRNESGLTVVAKMLLRATNLGCVGASLMDASSMDIFSVSPDGSAKSSAYLLRLAGRTVSGQQECLVEVSLPFGEEGGEGRVRVHTEAISLGLQLAKEVVDRICSSG